MRSAMMAAAWLLTGCNHYEFFAIAGYEQQSFSNEADVLFVIDNSTSMWDESGDMALNFNTFISYLTDPNGGGTAGTGSLTDAVGNYLSFTTERGSVLDYRLGITTTAVQITEGPTSTLDPGEMGTLIGGIMTPDSGTVNDDFRQSLLCEATCWSPSQLPDDKGYVCGSDTDFVSTDYLNCPDNCGVAGWDYDHCGPGEEEHLEAAFLALCRSVDNPPPGCFEAAGDVQLTQNDILSNGEFLRGDSTVVVVIVSDEGDSSRRETNGVDVPEEYAELFASFGRTIRFAAIGPKYEDGALTCNSGSATAWGVERLQYFANTSGGFYNYIADDVQSGACAPTDFAEHLTDLGALLNNLLTSFKLRSIPDESTIRAYVEGEEIDPAELDGDVGDPEAVYGTGWSYDPSENAVTFWGDAVPDYNESVRIIYRPLEGKPRDLPF